MFSPPGDPEKGDEKCFSYPCLGQEALAVMVRRRGNEKGFSDHMIRKISFKQAD
jgi:hypothetical protein